MYTVQDSGVVPAVNAVDVIVVVVVAVDNGVSEVTEVAPTQRFDRCKGTSGGGGYRVYQVEAKRSANETASSQVGTKRRFQQMLVGRLRGLFTTGTSWR